MRFFVLPVILALWGCSSPPGHQPGAGPVANKAETPAMATTSEPEARRSILGNVHTNSRGRDLLPKELVARMDEELRWSAFLERVFQVSLFRGTVDFDPTFDAMRKLQVYATGADSLTHNLADAPTSGRDWYVKKIEEFVAKAHEYRLKASTQVFQVLPTETDTYEADFDLLSGK